MITDSAFSAAKVLLSTFLSLLLFSGQAFSEPTSPGHIDLASDVKLLQSRIDALVVPYLDSASFSGDVLAVRNGKVLFNREVVTDE